MLKSASDGNLSKLRVIHDHARLSPIYTNATNTHVSFSQLLNPGTASHLPNIGRLTLSQHLHKRLIYCERSSPQTCFAISTSSLTLAHHSSSLRSLPSMVELCRTS